jgi:hypothetical protein
LALGFDRTIGKIVSKQTCRLATNRQILHKRDEIGNLLGLGGMGRVCHSKNTQTGQPVAIKVLKENFFFP